MYEYHEFNLKEFMRKISKPSLPIASFQKAKNDRPMLVMNIENIKMILY